ncbi:D-alanyl-D-alanine carboxypeptidase [Altererythrobacter sp. KTW20L]|uniref:D-alanyl-D-alanine carboxypeptidase family protein n=1 Tax=Altererythrobacter sp. KTW20L TaxID=2942210 RepID=UPI0020BEBB3D|nr:D-alanyl-D-alanine carboxypeptidase family protein [Altererythrobacter sp. KTW20L]MCL6251079.1 D-alanyl-D-alanine carboxypeptidase [Altererythrobacter sp. KTW20L]
MGALLLQVPAAQAATAPVPPEIPVALLVDLSTGQELFAREPARRFMPASVVKVMTTYTAFRLMAEGRISPNTRYEISPELEKEWSGVGSTMFLKAGERPTLGEILLGATSVSGNDASVALALASTGSVQSWLDLMNANAADLGMRDTHFGSANGYPDHGRTFTTAHDLARLGEAVVTRYPGLYRRYFGHRTMTWRNITQQNHDPVTGRVQGADGMKTGYTNEAGFTFLGSGERDGRRLIMVLAGAPSGDARDQAARALLEWGFSSFATRELAPPGTVVGRARVQNGDALHVDLRAPRGVNLALPVGGARVKQMSIRYNGPLLAPIAEGDEVAVLHVEIEGQAAFDVPLAATEAVGQAGFFRRIVNGLAGFIT